MNSTKASVLGICLSTVLIAYGVSNPTLKLHMIGGFIFGLCAQHIWTRSELK